MVGGDEGFEAASWWWLTTGSRGLRYCGQWAAPRAELPGAAWRGGRAQRALGQRQGGKASAMAKIILLSDPGCLVQSHIPVKVSLALPWLSVHRGREGVFRAGQTILRPDSEGTDGVTESRFGCRMLVGIPSLSLALGHYHWDMPCLSLPILLCGLYSSMETAVLGHCVHCTLHTCFCRDAPMGLAGAWG